MDFIIKIDVKKRDVSYPETFLENTIRHFIEMKVTVLNNKYAMNTMLLSELSYRSKTRKQKMR